jgi:multiple sugar transport system permease protein
VTFLIVGGAVAVELVVGIILALALFGNFRARSLFYSILIVPLAVAPIVLGILSSPNAIWDDVNTGLFYGTGLGIFIDLFQPAAFYSVIILADAWLWAPLIMLVVLAILQGIPREQFEAAEIHGSSGWRTFRSIVFPAIIKSPVLGFVLTLRVIDAFKSFEIPFAWTFWLGQNDLGSPVDTFSVLMWKLLTTSVYDFPLAAIATIALLSTVIILAFAAITLRFTGKVLRD